MGQKFVMPQLLFVHFICTIDADSFDCVLKISVVELRQPQALCGTALPEIHAKAKQTWITLAVTVD